MDLRERNLLQIEEIEKHKWIESEKAGHDLGEEHPVETDKLPTDESLKADNGVSTNIP